MCRRGYFADVAPRIFDATQQLVYSRCAAAASSATLFDDVEVSLKVENASGSGSTGIRMSLRIHPAADMYALHEGRYTGRMAISYFLFGRDGELKAEDWDRLEMALKPETYDQVLREGFPLKKELDLPEAMREALLRVVVYDIAEDRLGSVEAEIEANR